MRPAERQICKTNRQPNLIYMHIPTKKFYRHSGILAIASEPNGWDGHTQDDERFHSAIETMVLEANRMVHLLKIAYTWN